MSSAFPLPFSILVQQKFLTLTRELTRASYQNNPEAIEEAVPAKGHIDMFKRNVDTNV